MAVCHSASWHPLRHCGRCGHQGAIRLDALRLRRDLAPRLVGSRCVIRMGWQRVAGHPAHHSLRTSPPQRAKLLRLRRRCRRRLASRQVRWRGLCARLAPRGGTSGHHRDRRDRRQRRAEHSAPRPTSSPQARRTTAAVLAGRSELGRGQSGNGDRAAPSRCALKPTDARHSMQSPRAARGGPNVQPRSPLCHRHEPDQETHSFCQIRPPTNRR